MPLYLSTFPNGIYRLRGTHHGRRVDESTRTRVAADAEKIREAVEREIFNEVILGVKRERTFAEAASGYMLGGGEREHLAPIIVRLGKLKLSEVTQDRIDEAALKIYPDAKDSTRLRRVYTPVSAVMNWAVDAWKVEKRRIRRPKPSPGAVDWRTPAEIEQWIAAAEHIAPLFTFIVGTGARASEAVELNWPAITPAAGRVILWETKGGYSRHVDLQPRVRASLPQRGEGRVWRNRDGDPWHCYDAVNLWLKRAAVRKGLPHIHLHVLRHTWATWAYAVTKDLTMVMQQGGWRSADLAMRYVHAGTDELAKEVLAHGWYGSGRPERPRIVRPLRAKG